MTNDYAARKGGKRKRKAPPNTVDFSAQADLGGRKERPKRPKVRRLCRGHCYQEPVVKAEDKQWPQEEMVEGAQTKAIRRSELPIVVAGQPPKREKETKTKTKTKRRRGKRSHQNHVLSTEVNLKAPSTGDEECASESQQQTENSSVALKMYPDGIQRYMAAVGFIEPTPVQEGCWPRICNGEDIVGVAEPGSGKTLAYLLPAAAKMGPWMACPDAGQPPWVVILVPTRELANQILVACRPLYKLFGARTAHIYGGVDKNLQIEALVRNPHIIIGTPGRMIELMNEGHLSFDRVKYVALDEGDKLLSPGMIEEVEVLRQAILVGKDNCPQVVLFSATVPDSCKTAMDKWMKSSSKMEFQPSARSVSHTITQVVHVCAEHKKPAKLLKHLQLIKDKSQELRQRPRVLIFANTVKAVRFLEGELKEEFKVVMLHGKRTQKERDQAIMDFKAGKSQILIATDVAARGLHIRNLPYIVNYDFPSRLDTYIHRVGRTGRLAAYGHAYSFFTRNLAKLAPDLVDLLEHHKQPIDPNLVLLLEAFETAQKVMSTVDEGENGDEDSLQEILSEDDENKDAVDVNQGDDGNDGILLGHMADALLDRNPSKKRKKIRKKGLLKG